MNKTYNAKDLQDFKTVFKKLNKYYKFVCFTVFGAVFKTNDGYLALIKPY